MLAEAFAWLALLTAFNVLGALLRRSRENKGTAEGLLGTLLNAGICYYLVQFIGRQITARASAS
jgi:hypothetical protein